MAAQYLSKEIVFQTTFSDYISYIDILFICKQIFDINSYDFKIKDEKENMIVDDASMLKVISIHKEEEEEEGETCAYVGGDGVEFETSDDFDVNVSSSVDSDANDIKAETSFSFDVVVGDAAINMCSNNKNDEEKEDQDYIPYDNEDLVYK